MKKFYLPQQRGKRSYLINFISKRVPLTLLKIPLFSLKTLSRALSFVIFFKILTQSTNFYCKLKKKSTSALQTKMLFSHINSSNHRTRITSLNQCEQRVCILKIIKYFCIFWFFYVSGEIVSFEDNIKSLPEMAR